MIESLRCDTNADVLDVVRQSGRDYEIIARTIYGLEMVCVRMGGNKAPAIVITAGSHANEPAGVLAALSLINTLETEHAVHVVPLRDPYGWEGFARCLGYALGQERTIESHNDAERILTEQGTVVHKEEDDSLIVSLIGDLVFVSMRTETDVRGRRDVAVRLEQAMRDKPELGSILVGKRVCWPSYMPQAEGCRDYYRACSEFVVSPRVTADLNRQFTYAYPPIEVACVRDLINTVKPGLSLDLHEGRGGEFFLFTSPYEPGDHRERIALATLEAVAERGYELYSLEELNSDLSDLEKEGMVSHFVIQA